MAHDDGRVPEPEDGEGAAAAPDADADAELTVEDILGAEQAAAAAGDPSGGAPGAPPEAGADGAGAGAGDAADNPYLDDLRRLSAEYANYRKRTEANAELERRRAMAAAVTPLLGVLDDFDRAEQHGDLVEGSAFATIAQKVRGSMERLGLESFGVAGEPFDPSLHEAIARVPVAGTEEPTVLEVIERGYRVGEVELRPAKVAVAVGADG